MKNNLSVKSLDVLKFIAAQGGTVNSHGMGREGRPLQRLKLVKKNKGLFKITATGRKYLDKIPF